MHYDFRFKNSHGKWESRGHKKGANRAAAIRAMQDNGAVLIAGSYMSRPRGRQKDWDLFSIDHEGRITTAAQDSPARSSH